MGFVFYDLETTGTDTRFDQILHFAAIRTDAELNEEQRIELRCRLDRHVVPHPEALLLTRRSISDIREPELPSHYAMMREVVRLFEGWSPATIIGFNSIRFDEELLRHAFYKTLHDPYLTSRHNNVRADALTLCRSVAYFSPGALAIPLDADGIPRFKLAMLHTANGGAPFDAHEAMADAEATLALCRQVRARDEDTWWRFLRFSSKSAVESLLDVGQAFGVVRFRGNTPQPAAAVSVGRHKNLRFCLDLSRDLEALAAASDETLTTRLSSEDSPMFKLRANACPAVCDLWDLPLASRAHLSDEECDALAARVRSDPRLGARLLALAVSAQPQFASSPHVDLQLYEDFLPDCDNHLLRAFHNADWDRRLELVGQFSDPRWRKLAQRLTFLEAPHVLPPAQKTRFEGLMSERLRAGSEARPWRTIEDALAEIDRLGSECPADMRMEFERLGQA